MRIVEGVTDDALEMAKGVKVEATALFKSSKFSQAGNAFIRAAKMLPRDKEEVREGEGKADKLLSTFIQFLTLY